LLNIGAVEDDVLLGTYRSPHPPSLRAQPNT